MNPGVLQSSQMMAAGNPNWWNINSIIRPNCQQSSPFLSPYLFPQYPSSSSSFLLPSNCHDHNQDLPETWSQIMGGLVGEDDQNKGNLSNYQGGKLDSWEEHILHQDGNDCRVNVKQENSTNSYVYGHSNEDFIQAVKPTWSQIIPASSPNSCITTFSSNMLDFSNTKSDGRHPPPDRSFECNSNSQGGAIKKARVNQSSSTQSTFKVRKEKLGDRITSLHQLVSPFGKTDTASVLLEAIGYIRFLHNQIEALSLPYLGNGPRNIRQQQQSVQGERDCLFPEDPGQLLNENCIKKKGTSEQGCCEEETRKKDLKSRGLCLVPVSCTMQVGNDNGADYWAPAFNGGFR